MKRWKVYQGRTGKPIPGGFYDVGDACARADLLSSIEDEPYGVRTHPDNPRPSVEALLAFQGKPLPKPEKPRRLEERTWAVPPMTREAVRRYAVSLGVDTDEPEFSHPKLTEEYVRQFIRMRGYKT